MRVVGRRYLRKKGAVLMRVIAITELRTISYLDTESARCCPQLYLAPGTLSTLGRVQCACIDLHLNCCCTYIASSTNDYFRMGQTNRPA